MENLFHSGKTTLKNKLNNMQKSKATDIIDTSIEKNKGKILDSNGEGNSLKKLIKDNFKSKEKKEDKIRK